MEGVGWFAPQYGAVPHHVACLGNITHVRGDAVIAAAAHVSIDKDLYSREHETELGGHPRWRHEIIHRERKPLRYLFTAPDLWNVHTNLGRGIAFFAIELLTGTLRYRRRVTDKARW